MSRAPLSDGSPASWKDFERKVHQAQWDSPLTKHMINRDRGDSRWCRDNLWQLSHWLVNITRLPGCVPGGSPMLAPGGCRPSRAEVKLDPCSRVSGQQRAQKPCLCAESAFLCKPTKLGFSNP